MEYKKYIKLHQEYKTTSAFVTEINAHFLVKYFYYYWVYGGIKCKVKNDF